MGGTRHCSRLTRCHCYWVNCDGWFSWKQASVVTSMYDVIYSKHHVLVMLHSKDLVLVMPHSKDQVIVMSHSKDQVFVMLYSQ